MMEDSWTRARDALVRAITDLGFPAELGDAIAKHLGSPEAMDRMAGYLCCARPNRAEDIVDEMLAIRSEIDAWKEKKSANMPVVRSTPCCAMGWKRKDRIGTNEKSVQKEKDTGRRGIRSGFLYAGDPSQRLHREKVAGFRGQDVKLHEIKLIRNEKDLDTFCEQYGVHGDIETIY